MGHKKLHTEKNIDKLICSVLNEQNCLDKEYKEIVLKSLLNRMVQQNKEIAPKIVSVIGLFVMWLTAVILSILILKDSITFLYLIKTALKMSLFLIPGSSLLLIIIKLRTDEK